MLILYKKNLAILNTQGSPRFFLGYIILFIYFFFWLYYFYIALQVYDKKFVKVFFEGIFARLNLDCRLLENEEKE